MYAGNTRTCVTTCGRGAGTHGDVLNVHTEFFSVPHHTARTHHDHNDIHNTIQQQHATSHGDRDRKKTEKEDRERETEKERQDKTKEKRQDKTREDKTIQNKTRQDKMKEKMKEERRREERREKGEDEKEERR